MTTTVQRDSLDDNFGAPKLNSTLNILTILTIIGCVIALLGIAWNVVSIETEYRDMDKNIAAMNQPDAPAFVKGMMPDAATYKEMITNSYENRYVLLELGLIATALCFVGALQMRKLKKSGYLLYVVGEVMPIIYGAVLVGTMMLSGMMLVVSCAIPVIFIILYTFQRKNLVY